MASGRYGSRFCMWLLPRLSDGIRSLRLAVLYMVLAETEWWHPVATARGSDTVSDKQGSTAPVVKFTAGR